MYPHELYTSDTATGRKRKIRSHPGSWIIPYFIPALLYLCHWVTRREPAPSTQMPNSQPKHLSTQPLNQTSD